MLLIVGVFVVLGSVCGGYLMAGGHMLLLMQPSEFVIILGAAAGSLLISTSPKVLIKLLGQCKALLGSGLTQNDFADLLSMLYQMFRVSQQTGVMALEAHFENPEQSAILSRYPKFLARHHSVAFLSDSFKVIIVGGMAPHDLEALMDEDLQVHHDEERGPSAALMKVADALPGLGIVAAVLGIVITMQAIDGPPAEIGHHVGAALVGTFLGILHVVRLRPADGERPRAARRRTTAATSSASRPGCSPRSRACRRRSPSSSRAAFCRTTCGRPSRRPRGCAVRHAEPTRTQAAAA